VAVEAGCWEAGLGAAGWVAVKAVAGLGAEREAAGSVAAVAAVAAMDLAVGWAVKGWAADQAAAG